MFFLLGCAGSNILEDNKEVDIEKVFKLEKDKLEQFSIVKKKKSKPSQKKKIADQESITKKTKVKTKKEKKKAKKSKRRDEKSQSESQISDQQNKNIEAVDITTSAKPEDHPDYPSSFKKYNERYEKFWNKHKHILKSGEKYTFDISWTIFRAGVATIEVVDDIEVAGEDAFMLKAELNSAKYFENIYKLNNTLRTYVKKENFFPIKYEMKQRESGQNVDDVQLFDEKELKTYFYYKRLKKGKLKKKSEEKFIPRFFTDSFSALFFVRGLPLKTGYKFGFPMVTRTKVWLLKAEVIGEERINIMDQYINTYKVKAVTQFPGVLKKRGDIVFWFSKDQEKRLLKFEAKIKIGSVKGELIDYTPGK